jgi:hypothetical protein
MRSAKAKGVAVLVVQVLLVLSIAAKYAWERHHCPMVWAKSQQWDPDQPLRGRYLAISVYANACGLAAGSEERNPGPSSYGPRFRVPQVDGVQEWRVVPAVRGGELAPRVVDETRPGPTQELTLEKGMPCEYARLSGTSDFFIPEHAKSPFPLQKGQELWALVTVPPSGPVRPVKLAVSDASGFHVLNLD